MGMVTEVFHSDRKVPQRMDKVKMFANKIGLPLPKCKKAARDPESDPEWQPILFFTNGRATPFGRNTVVRYDPVVK